MIGISSGKVMFILVVPKKSPDDIHRLTGLLQTSAGIPTGTAEKNRPEHQASRRTAVLCFLSRAKGWRPGRCGIPRGNTRKRLKLEKLWFFKWKKSGGIEAARTGKNNLVTFGWVEITRGYHWWSSSILVFWNSCIATQEDRKVKSYPKSY